MSSPTKARMSENSPPNLGIRLAKTTPTTTIWQLLVILFRKYMTSHGPRTLHEGPEKEKKERRVKLGHCASLQSRADSRDTDIVEI